MSDPNFITEKDLSPLMEDFPSNSHSEKEQAPKPKKPVVKKAAAAAPKDASEVKGVSKVVTGQVIEKKGLGKKFRSLFGGADFRTVAQYVLTEVLIPAAKGVIVDAASKGMQRMMYGDDPRKYPQGGLGGIGRPGNSRMTYNTSIPFAPLSTPGGYLPGQSSMMPHRQQDINDIVIIDLGEARLVIERMGDIIGEYQVATVGDFKQLIGLPSTFVDQSYGWTSIQYFDIQQVREGYLIRVPNAIPI